MDQAMTVPATPSLQFQPSFQGNHVFLITKKLPAGSISRLPMDLQIHNNGVPNLFKETEKWNAVVTRG